MKPTIALTTDLVLDTRRPEGPPKLNLAWEYSQAISEAGGNPVVLTPQTEVEPLLEWIDGWVIPGGDDIDACRWGEPNHPRAILQRPERFEWEERIFRAAPRRIFLTANRAGVSTGIAKNRVFFRHSLPSA